MSSYWDKYSDDFSCESEYLTEKDKEKKQLIKETTELINQLNNSGSDVLISFNKEIVPVEKITNILNKWKNR